MQAFKLFALSALSVIAFDAIASFASLLLGFSYSYATLGSAVLYIALTYIAARRFGFGVAILLGVVMGIVDVTIGWAVSWAIGPGRVSIEGLTPTDWIYTGIFAAVLGAVFGLIGGGIGTLVRRRRVA